MPSIDFVCLANSKKNLERCVAGLRVDNGKWIRPVSGRPHGELCLGHRQLETAGEPRHFDLLRVGLKAPLPSNGQPENWLIDETPWQLVARPAPSDLSRLVRKAISQDPLLFGDTSNSIPSATFNASKSISSLVLVKPSKPSWRTTLLEDKKKARVGFSLASAHYSLPVTDPPVEQRLKDLEPGAHTSAELGIADESRMLFTISLGEQTEFDGRCYKLVAAVLVLPPHWPATSK